MRPSTIAATALALLPLGALCFAAEPEAQPAGVASAPASNPASAVVSASAATDNARVPPSTAVLVQPNPSARKGAKPLPPPFHPEAPLPVPKYPISDTRFFFAQDMGTLQSGALWIEGKRMENEGAELYAGMNAGVSTLFWKQILGLRALARFGTANTYWSRQRGEGRVRYDFALGIEARAPVRSRPRAGWHVAAPLGLTIEKASAQSGNSVQESYATGLGMNVGLLGGFDIAGLHHGATFDLVWLIHAVWMDHRATLVNPPKSSIQEQYRFVDHALMLSIGYIYWL